MSKLRLWDHGNNNGIHWGEKTGCLILFLLTVLLAHSKMCPLWDHAKCQYSAPWPQTDGPLLALSPGLPHWSHLATSSTWFTDSQVTGFRAPPQISLRLKFLIASLHLIWGTPTNISCDQRQPHDIKPKGFQFQLPMAGCCSVCLVLTITRTGHLHKRQEEGRDIYRYL